MARNDLARYAAQGLLCGAVSVGQCEGGAILFGGVRAIGLLFKYLAEQQVRFEDGRFFHGIGGVEVAAEKAHRQGGIVAAANKDAGAVD